MTSPLVRAVLLGTVLVAGAASCETRNVYLVPTEQGSTPGRTPEGGTGGVQSAPPDSGTWMPPYDSGHHTDSGSPCETNRYVEEPRPLGVYFMVDQSSTMTIDERWREVSAALTQFISDGDKLGNISIGIQYYALTPPANAFIELAEYQKMVCDPVEYSYPDVEINPIAQNQTRLLQSVAAHGPSILTPIIAALKLPEEIPIDLAIQGGIQGARDWMATYPDALEEPRAVVILVTDKVPLAEDMAQSQCKPTPEKAILAAADGPQKDPSVPVYVLGVGSGDIDPNLDAIAAAGGTAQAYTPKTGGDLASTLQLIREKALPCDVVAGDAKAVTTNLFNVDLVHDGHSERFGRVADAGGCHADRTNEWYSAVEKDRSVSVRLCPSTCTYARTPTKASLNVVLGCPTVVLN